MLERFVFDLRQALRGLRRRPAYAIAGISTLALVIGVNATLFAAINATLFRHIGLKSGERTVTIYTMPPGLTDAKDRNPLHAIDLVRFRERSRTLTHISGMSLQERVLGTSDDPLVVRTAAVSAELLGLAPQSASLGRVFDEAEETRRDRVVVMSNGFWRRQFGGDPAIVGRVITLDAEPYTVLGVMPPSFPPQFLEADLWTPLGITTSASTDDSRTYIVPVAELAGGATLPQADAEIRRIIGDLAKELPRTHRGFSAGVIGFREWQYGQFKAPLAILFLAVTTLTLIAAFNVASLTLANVTARQGEMALRRAMGATRWAIARLVIAEIAIINVIGAVCAVAMGAWLLPALLRIAPATTAVLGEVGMDWRVALYALACAVLASLAAGVVPALCAADSSVGPGGSNRAIGSRERQRWRTALLTVQIALSVALLVAGGLLVRAMMRTAGTRTGFDATRVLTAQLRLPPSRYGSATDRVGVLARILDGAVRIPGVLHAASTQNQFKPGFSYQTMMEIENRPTPTGAPYTVQWRRISPDYFQALRIRLIAGRAFTAQDDIDTPPVAIVSEAFARRYWEDLDPIGRRIRRGTKFLTVVGVVGDVSDVDLLQPPEPTLYGPWAQTSNTNFPIGLVVRTAGNPMDAASSLRTIVAAADPTLALDRIQPLETFLADSLAPQRFRTTLMLGLAVVGLLLGAIGVAGVTARSIAERMPEFGVRLALGCGSGALWRGTVLEQLRVVALAAAIGVALAIAAGRVLGAVLPEIEGIDAAVIATALGALASAVLLAAAIPAARVLRVDPSSVLRN
jgi:putative ABC transport system permease protein